MQLSDARVLVVGMGGLGCPASLALVRAGVGRLRIADDDVVELHNLHRQILFEDADVGQRKVEVARRALSRLGDAEIEPVFARFLPENAIELLRNIDLVVEGCDNVPTKFLVSDACFLSKVAVIHAAAVAWHGTALAVGPAGGPCYRCVFEDIPEGGAPNCAEVGAMGPAVGRVAALQVDLAFRAIAGLSPWGQMRRSDGLTGRWRDTMLQARAECILCGHSPSIRSITRAQYTQETA